MFTKLPPWRDTSFIASIDFSFQACHGIRTPWRDEAFVIIEPDSTYEFKAGQHGGHHSSAPNLPTRPDTIALSHKSFIISNHCKYSHQYSPQNTNFKIRTIAMATVEESIGNSMFDVEKLKELGGLSCVLKEGVCLLRRFPGISKRDLLNTNAFSHGRDLNQHSHRLHPLSYPCKEREPSSFDVSTVNPYSELTVRMRAWHTNLEKRGRS